MDEYQKYKVKGLDNQADADVALTALVDVGYYQCSIDIQNSILIVPVSFAGYIDDIEKILLSIGYEFLEE